MHQFWSWVKAQNIDVGQQRRPPYHNIDIGKEGRSVSIWQLCIIEDISNFSQVRNLPEANKETWVNLETSWQSLTPLDLVTRSPFVVDNTPEPTQDELITPRSVLIEPTGLLTTSRVWGSQIDNCFSRSTFVTWSGLRLPELRGVLLPFLSLLNESRTRCCHYF